MTEVLLCLFHLYKTCQNRRNRCHCRPHKGSKDGASLVFTSGHQCNARTLRLSGCPHAHGRLIYRQECVCSNHFIMRKVWRTLQHGAGRQESPNVLCGLTKPLEGSVKTPGNGIPLWGGVAHSYTGVALALEQTGPLCDSGPLTLPLWTSSCSSAKWGQWYPPFWGCFQDCRRTEYSGGPGSKKACKK